ncbi:unnamed protein product [Rhizoctonia solani]|uniref:Non-haem dioxygenase N-terminal domain-containing protein n=1 Tax=Rhizoctonia solani TaxID=456999 RepID=A0A8H3ALC2_9AGAM|nr:unnamed protein product [Rhizoctonia solani]CAE6517264.1 unnamed protein product [Rhizoctonia solani]
MSTVDLISLATQPVRPFKSIPLIDVSGLSGDSDSKARVASAIREALKNHGVDEATIASVVAASHRFFDLPQEEKMKVSRSVSIKHKYTLGGADIYFPDVKLDKGRNFPGYSRVTSSEGTIVRESFSVGTGTETCPDAHDPVHKQNTWPSENALPGFEEPVLRLHYEITQFALKLTSAFALALNLPEDIFDDKVIAIFHSPS